MSSDELIFLLPSLCRDKTEGDARARRYFRRALAARLHVLVRRAAVAGGDAAEAAIAAIAKAGVVKTMRLEMTLPKAEKAWSGLYSDEASAPIAAPDPRVRSEEARAYWIFELSVLASLDAAVSAAEGREASADGGEQLPAALVASIYSGVNAAYAFPHLECAHELLSVGVWLGYLLRGRRAMMPPFVAERLIAHFADALDSAATTDKCDDLIVFHAEAAAGIARLMRSAKGVYRSGVASLVRPRPATAAKGGRRPQWDPTLTKLIGDHLEACFQDA